MCIRFTQHALWLMLMESPALMLGINRSVRGGRARQQSLCGCAAAQWSFGLLAAYSIVRTRLLARAQLHRSAGSRGRLCINEIYSWSSGGERRFVLVGLL